MIWFLILLPCFLPFVLLQESCDVLVQSSRFGSKNGTLTSPNFPSTYPPNTTCVYRIVGLKTERVRLQFTHFDVKGVPPKCTQDYMELFTQATDAFQNLLDQLLNGRYCGSDLNLLPQIIISMNNIVIVAFFTDHTKELNGFSFDYSFIDNSPYISGTFRPEQPCKQTIKSIHQQSGVLLSPTFPGVYPDNINCHFQLLGQPGQRVRLHFEVIDLFSGGDHCPYDYIRLYDGESNLDKVIDTFCGYSTNITIYSSSSSLFLEFITKEGREENARRTYNPSWTPDLLEPSITKSGFKATYFISNQFIDLAFITDGEHVLGTECDQRVLSRKESWAYITSPNYPNNYRHNTSCYYFIDGMEDRQNLEKAKLTILYIDIPPLNEKCEGSYLSAYLKGQRNKEDIKLCGLTPPAPLTSSNPRLMLHFYAVHNSPTASGFKARVDFLTDFAIPGTPASDHLQCQFTYHSSSANQGTFNSPRHPSNYPDNALCVYYFYPKPFERVRITFETFRLEESSNCTAKDDVVLIFNSLPNKGPLQETFLHHPPSIHQTSALIPLEAAPYILSQDRLVAVHCGDSNP